VPAPLVYVFSPISADDRWVLQRFVSKVDALNASSFRDSETKLRATAIPGATYLGGPAWHMRVEGPDEQALSLQSAMRDYLSYWTLIRNLAAAVLKRFSARSSCLRGRIRPGVARAAR